MCGVFLALLIFNMEKITNTQTMCLEFSSFTSVHVHNIYQNTEGVVITLWQVLYITKSSSLKWILGEDVFGYEYG